MQSFLNSSSASHPQALDNCRTAMTRVALVAGFAALNLFFAVDARPAEGDDKPDSWNPIMDDMDKFCYGHDYMTPEEADAFWYDTGAFLSLDSWIDAFNGKYCASHRSSLA